jgi:fucose permease
MKDNWARMKGMQELTETQPDIRYRHIATAAAFANFFSTAVILTVIQATITQIGSNYQATGAQLGWIIRLIMLGGFVSLILGGHWADRIGKLPGMILGCACLATGMIIFFRSQSFSSTIVAATIAGLGTGFTQGLSAAAITDLYSGANRTVMANVGQVAFATGAVIAPAATARLLGLGYDWRLAFLIAAIVCVAAGLMTLLAAAQRREKKTAGHHDKVNLRTIITDPLIPWLCVGIMLYVSAENGTASWLTSYLSRDIGASIPMAAISVAVFWFGIGVGRASVTLASRKLNDLALISACIAIACISEICLLLSHNYAFAIVAVFLTGLGMGPIWPTIVSCAGGAYPSRSGAVVGIIVASGGLGGGLIPPIIGRVADMSSMRVGMWICVLVLVINAFVFARLKKRVHEESVQSCES